MNDDALGRLQLVHRTRGGGIFTCVAAAVCMILAGAAVPQLYAPDTGASDRALVIGLFAVGMFLAYLGAVLLSTRLEFRERGVAKRSLRGNQVVRYAELESLRFQSSNIQGAHSITHIYRSRASGSRDLVAILRAGPKGLAEFRALTAAAVDPLAARLASELARAGAVRLPCGLTLTADAVELAGERIPLSQLTVEFEPIRATLRFRNGGREAFKVPRDELNVLPLMALIERRAALAA